MICQNCGSQIEDGTPFCKICGQPVKVISYIPKTSAVQQNSTIAATTDEQPKEKNKKKVGIILLVAAAVVILFFSLYSNETNNEFKPYIGTWELSSYHTYYTPDDATIYENEKIEITRNNIIFSGNFAKYFVCSGGQNKFEIPIKDWRYYGDTGVYDVETNNNAQYLSDVKSYKYYYNEESQIGLAFCTLTDGSYEILLLATQDAFTYEYWTALNGNSFSVDSHPQNWHWLNIYTMY